MAADLQLLVAVVAIEASLVEDLVRGAALLRRVDRLLTSHAFVAATETEGFTCISQIKTVGVSELI